MSKFDTQRLQIGLANKISIVLGTARPIIPGPTKLTYRVAKYLL